MCRLFYRTEKVIKLFDMLDVDMKYELAIRKHQHKHTLQSHHIGAVGSQRVLVSTISEVSYTQLD